MNSEREKEINNCVAHNFDQIRKLKGYTQIDIGKCVDVTFQQIQKYGKGTNRITAGKLYMFAEFLEVDISAFYRNLDNKEYDTDCVISDDELRLIRDFRKIKSKEQKNSIKNIINSMGGNGG